MRKSARTASSSELRNRMSFFSAQNEENERSIEFFSGLGDGISIASNGRFHCR